jgi:hypothetical protein
MNTETKIALGAGALGATIAHFSGVSHDMAHALKLGAIIGLSEYGATMTMPSVKTSPDASRAAYYKQAAATGVASAGIAYATGVSERYLAVGLIGAASCGGSTLFFAPEVFTGKAPRPHLAPAPGGGGGETD